MTNVLHHVCNEPGRLFQALGSVKHQASGMAAPATPHLHSFDRQDINEHLIPFVDSSKTLARMALVCPAWWRAARQAAGYRLRALAGHTRGVYALASLPARGAAGERIGGHDGAGVGGEERPAGAGAAGGSGGKRVAPKVRLAVSIWGHRMRSSASLTLLAANKALNQ